MRLQDNIVPVIGHWKQALLFVSTNATEMTR